MAHHSESAAALPVEVVVDARMREALVNHLEGPLGWQVTTGDDLPAVLRLVSVAVGEHARADAHPDVTSAGMPVVLLVRPDDDPADAAVAARAADHVLRWPDERARLPEVAAAVAGRAHDVAAAPTVTFGGAAGGVGTTTVTVAVGGLLSWSGRPTLCVVSGPSPAGELPVVEPGALAGHRTWDAARDVDGVPGLRAVTTAPGARSEVQVSADTAVLHDLGVASDPDVLVMTRDRAGLRAASSTSAGVVVVIDRGVVPLAVLARDLAGRRVLTVPMDVRVGRAGATGHAPSALPGRWLAALDPLARLLGA